MRAKAERRLRDDSRYQRLCAYAMTDITHFTIYAALHDAIDARRHCHAAMQHRGFRHTPRLRYAHYVITIYASSATFNLPPRLFAAATFHHRLMPTTIC